MPAATEDDDNVFHPRSSQEQGGNNQDGDNYDEAGDDDDNDDDHVTIIGTRNTRRQREDEENDAHITNPSRRARFDDGIAAAAATLESTNTTPPTPTRATVHHSMPTPITNSIGIISALGRAYPSGYTRAEMRAELEMQANIKGDNQAMATFRTEILQQQGLTVFAFLQPKDTTIHLMHSPATYYARGASGPLRGKDIGFVGDRSVFNSPAPIVLQPEKPWKWMTKQIVAEAPTLEYFYANPHNKGKLFTPATGATLTRVTAPRLLLLPGNLIHYCAEAPRTPWDLHQHVTSLLAAPDSGYDFQHYALVLDWCFMASHMEGSGNDSVLQYELQAAASNDIFHRWARTRIHATLGSTQAHTPAQPHMAPPQDLTQLSTIAAEFGRGVIDALRPPTATATIANVLGTTQAGTDTKEYDKFQKAILKGFSHCPTEAGLQPIWDLFCKTKNVDTHRLHLREEMEKWAAKWGVTITRGIHLSKIAIDDIVNLRFNPGGSVAYYATAEKGISILLCRSRPGEERETARLRELAEEQSGANITLAEALSLRRNTPQSPPDNYIDLKTCIGTFCAMLWALFGDNCEYLQKLHEIYTCMDSDRVTECWANFDSTLCRQIVWAIIDDGREYFSQALLPDKFLVPPGGYIRYPRSSLEELIRPIKRQSPILTATFPSQWLTRQMAATTTTPAWVGTRPSAPTTTTAPVATVVTATRNNNSNNTTASRASSAATSTASSLTGASTQQQQRGIRQSNLHPTIKALMEPFINRHGQLQLTRIMMVGGVTWADMPKIERLVENGTNNLCYNYILGKCVSRYCNHRRAGHINATDVPDGFATTLCNTLRPGIDNMTDTLMTMPWPDFQTTLASRRNTTE